MVSWMQCSRVVRVRIGSVAEFFLFDRIGMANVVITSFTCLVLKTL